MYPINSSIVTHIPQEQTKLHQKIEKIELSREEIISSKDLTPEQKMEKLGIKPMTTTEMANTLVNKIIDGEV
jgi:hypothetical protein